MAFAFIKSQQGSAATVSTVNLTVQAVPLNALVVVHLKLTAAVTGISVTDSAGNTYAQAGTLQGTGTNFMAQFYGVAATGGATTVTASWTGSASIRITADQFSGGQLTNAAVFDKAAQAGATGTAASVSLAPTNAGELIVAGIGMTSGTSAVTIGANYLPGTNNTSASSEYRLVGTASETAPLSWTGSTAWAEVAGAYIPLPAAATGNFMAFM